MLFDEYQRDIYRRTDRLFAWLMGFQWIAGIIFALWVSPLAWSGTVSSIHLHVWAAVVLGGLVSLFPALLAVLRPGEPSTRYTIAVAQMLMSALLIHLTGGRIETHFHVFGSLAFLAFYRDWRVLSRRRWSSRSITCCAGSSGRSRCTACWSRASGAGSSTRPGSSSKTSSSSSPASGALRRCASGRNAPRPSNRKCGRVSRPRTMRGRSPR